jgi:hypothetical protein
MISALPARIRFMAGAGSTHYALYSSTGVAVLWTIFVILLVLWLLGVVSANTFGGFIHVLLWAAIAVVLLRVLQGRRTTN